MTDKRLVTALKNGDNSAFDKLYHKYIQRLYAFVLKTAKSPKLAEDVVHDAFVKVWEERSELDPQYSFQSYLFTIARNRLLNLLKRSTHEASILEEMFEFANQEIWKDEKQDDYSESVVSLDKAIEQLPDRRKAILIYARNKGSLIKKRPIF